MKKKITTLIIFLFILGGCMTSNQLNNMRGDEDGYLKDLSTIVKKKDNNSILAEVIPSIDGENEYRDGTQITVNINSNDALDELEIDDEIIMQYLLIEKDTNNDLSVEMKSPNNIIKNGRKLIQY
ncbi:hypothetical protein DW196_10820 [Vagococcus sp. AM17-17]|nr:hypothetical protein DW196_10820 [Vagococcus sp. AM17-17]